MPHYHLHLFNDIDVLDETGAEYADLAAAKDVAIRAGREIMAEHVKLGRPIQLSHHLDIADDRGKVLAVIPFGEIITITP
jgi:hypothetical protein